MKDLQLGGSTTCRRDLLEPSGGWTDVWVCKELLLSENTLDGDGGAHLAVTARIRNGWMKFREFLPFLTSRALLR